MKRFYLVTWTSRVHILWYNFNNKEQCSALVGEAKKNLNNLQFILIMQVDLFLYSLWGFSHFFAAAIIPRAHRFPFIHNIAHYEAFYDDPLFYTHWHCLHRCWYAVVSAFVAFLLAWTSTAIHFDVHKGKLWWRLVKWFIRKNIYRVYWIKI